MLTTKNSEKIAKVLGQFDFVRTQKLMEHLEWGWGSEQVVPEVCNLVDTAYDLLHKAISGTGYCASGGFEAIYNNGELILKFVTDEAQIPSEDFIYEPVSVV